MLTTLCPLLVDTKEDDTNSRCAESDADLSTLLADSSMPAWQCRDNLDDVMCSYFQNLPTASSKFINGARRHLVKILINGARRHFAKMLTNGARRHLVNILTTGNGARRHLVNIVINCECRH